MLAFGEIYMAQIVSNARALASALSRRGLSVLGKSRGYTSTHQAIVDFSSLGGGRDAAQNLALADIIMNKNLLPAGSFRGLG
jgi:glycine hydroxymethyltransferase